MNLKRALFVLSHSANVAVVAGIGWLVFQALGLFGLCVFAGYAWVKAREFGEAVGRAKENGTFINTARGNWAVLKESSNSLWELLQAEGAVVVFLLIAGVFKLMS